MGGDFVKERRDRRSIISRTLKIIAVFLIVFGVIFTLWTFGVHYFLPRWRVERQLSKFESKVEPKNSEKTKDLKNDSTDVKILKFPLKLSMPSIELNWVVQEASRLDEKEFIPRDDLNKYGVVHYPNTVLPGQEGVCAIAGHRTTYGAPFWSFNELKEGDEVLLTSEEGLVLSYKVKEVRIINFDDISFLQLPSDGASVLCLTTCQPRFSSKQRICVICTLNQQKGLQP